MCFYKKKKSNEKCYFIEGKRKRKKKNKREGQSGRPVGEKVKKKKKKVSLVNGFHDFQLIYKKTTPLLEN